jgi:hypothetical protein
MVAIPLPLSSFPGASPSEGAGRLINVFAEALGENARARAVIHRVPGLAGWGTSDEETFRGSLILGANIYAAYAGTVVKYPASGGTATAVDDLDGTDKVYFLRNNRRPIPDVLIICAAGVFTLSNDEIDDLADPDLPTITAGVFLDGYFFVTSQDGRCFASGLNATTFGSNDFITTEAKADTLHRPVAWNGNLLLCGSGSIEVWDGDNPNDTGFPFNRVAVIQRGIIGPHAIAGFEDGFGKALMFVGDDNAVHVLNGYTPEKVSPPDLDRLIEAVADKTTLEAGVYIAAGHPKWVLSCPDWTWEFDLNTSKWNERRSYGATRWRGTQPFNAFGKWLCGDLNSGNIVEISSAAQTEVGAPLVCEVWSAPVHKFPQRLRVARADFDFSTGIGDAEGIDPNETAPRVEISYSDDGGNTFSLPRLRNRGRQGRFLERVTVFLQGQTGAQGRVYKIRMSDPRPFGLMAGDMSAEAKVA